MMTRLLKSKRIRFGIIAMLTLSFAVPFTTQKARAQQQCFEVWLTTPEVISGPGTYPFAVNYYWPGSGSSWKGNIVFSLITGPPSGVGVNPSRTSVPFQFPGVTGNTITSINVTISFDRIFADNPRDFALTMTAVATATETRGPTCGRFEVRHTYIYKAPAGAPAPGIGPSPAPPISPYGYNFTISVSPNADAVSPGDGVVYSVYVQVTGTSGLDLLSVEVSGLPPGAQGYATVRGAFLPWEGPIYLRVETTDTTPPGKYVLTITAFTTESLTSVTRKLSQSATVTLVVGKGATTAPFDFTVSASPASMTVQPGETARFNLTIPVTGRASRAVYGLGGWYDASENLWKMPGVPAGAAVSLRAFDVVPAVPTTLSVPLEIKTSPKTPVGQYEITVPIRISDDRLGKMLTRSTTVTLTVGTPFDFSLSPTPTSDKVWQGGMADYLVKVQVPQRRVIGLRVAVRDLPPGAKALVIPCGDMETSAAPRTRECQFALSGRLRTSEITIPQSTGEYLLPPEVVQIPQPQSFLLVIHTSLKTPPGNYGIKITVYTEDRKVSRDAEVTLTVEKADFSLSVHPSASQHLVEGAPEAANWTILVSSVGTPQTLLLDAVLRVRGDSEVAELRKGLLRVEWKPKRVPLLGPAYDRRIADLARAGEEAYWTATKPGALEEPLTLRVFLRQVILPPPLRALVVQPGLGGQDYEVEIQVTATREDGIAKSVTFHLLVGLRAPQRPREEAPPEPQRAEIPGQPHLPAVPPAEAQEPRILLFNVAETTTGVQVERDQVTTISGAFADVVLGDRGKVRIGPKSKVVFGRKARDLNAEADLVVITGKVHLSWKAESAPPTPPPGGIPPSEIKPGGMPIGGIGIHYGGNTVHIRGTEVLLEVAEDGAGALTVLDGVVEVRSRQEPGKVVLVMGGQRLLTRPSAPLPEPIAADKSFLSKVPPLTAALSDPDLTTRTWWAPPSQGSKAPKARGGLSCASPRTRDSNLPEADRGVGALDPILFFMIGLLGFLWYARRR